MNVKALIKILESLPEEQKEFPVFIAVTTEKKKWPLEGCSVTRSNRFFLVGKPSKA